MRISIGFGWFELYHAKQIYGSVYEGKISETSRRVVG
jgi:hypothetical protein